MQPSQYTDQDRWQRLLPEFAPLPRAFVELLFSHPERFTLPFTLSASSSLFEHIWANFQIARGNALEYVFPVVRAERVSLEHRLSMTWFQNAVQLFDTEKRLPRPATLADWQSRNVLRSRGFGIPEPNSVAALLIMRALSPRQRDWLPGSMREDEPWFWVWGQGPAEEKPQMYPFPLPVHLAPHTLLWTTWGGAAWLDGWKGIRQHGAIAWASTIPFRSQTWWHLSAEHLAAWDRDFVEHAHLNGTYPLSLPGFPRTSLDEDRYDLMRLHTLADELLVRIGEPFLYQHLERYYSQRVPLC